MEGSVAVALRYRAKLPMGTARAENPLVSRYIEKQVSWSRARGTRPDRNGNQLPLFRKGFLCLVL